jgi:hypothetical protein
MSDTTYEVFQHYGTSAQRAAFTPDPAAGIQPIYIWYETDTGNTYLFHVAWVQLSGVGSGGGSGIPNQLSFLIQGGIVTGVSGYDFNVSAALYIIHGFQYASPETVVTLSDADPDNPRIDVIAVDNTGSVVVIEGVAAETPSEPNVDPATQLKLSIIQVPANAPPVVTNTDLYLEGAGGPTEWDWTTSGSGLSLTSNSNPRTGTYDIEATNLPANSYAQAEKPTGTLDLTNIDLLIIYIRSKLTWASGKSLVVSLRYNGVLVGLNVTIARTGTFGFNSALTTDYQLVAIPITAFAIPAGSLINQLRITGTGTGTTQGFYLDDILFQASGATPVGGGITLAQADARYLQRLNNLTDLVIPAFATQQLTDFVGDTGGGGIKGLVPAPATGYAAANRYLKADGTWATLPAGSGDVVGPASAEGDNIVVFDSTTGKLVKDGGSTIAEVISAAVSAAGAGDVLGPVTNEDNNVAQFNGANSKTLEDSGYTVAEIISAGAAAAPQGDVTAAANVGDNRLIRGDGAGKGIQGSGISIDDSDNVKDVVSLAVGGDGELVAQTVLTVKGQLNIVPSNHSAAGATETIDFAVSNEHTVILDENITLTLSNPVDGGRYTIILIQDGTGTNTVTWPASVKWPGGTTPTITATGNRADLVTLYYYATGSVYFASINQNYVTS